MPHFSHRPTRTGRVPAPGRVTALWRGLAASGLVVAALGAVALIPASAASAAGKEARPAVHANHSPDAPGYPGTTTKPKFNECPAIGADTSCAILIVVTNSGNQILSNPTLGPYDGADDTLMGILNESTKPLFRIQLHGSGTTSPIFGFDGDGICTFAKGGLTPTDTGWTGTTYCSTTQRAGKTSGKTTDANGADYQGPTTTYSTISATATRGDVNFTGGLQTGKATYFSLEASLTAGQLGVQYGYWEVAADGGLFAYDAPFWGSTDQINPSLKPGGTNAVTLDAPIVGICADPNTDGYWEVAQDGGLFAFNAPFFGSMGGKPLNEPIVGMVATPDGLGYWEVASDGGLFAFGDAHFYGSMGGKPLNKPIVGIASTPDGHGYYEVASDGGLFAFGDAVFHGSMGGKPLNDPVVGIAGDQGTGGYWEVASDGGLFAFTAPFFGSPAAMPLNKPVVGMASTPDGQGYWEAASDGGIFNYGDAFFWGSTGSMTLNSPVVGIAGAQ